MIIKLWATPADLRHDANVVLSVLAGLDDLVNWDEFIPEAIVADLRDLQERLAKAAAMVANRSAAAVGLPLEQDTA